MKHFKEQEVTPSLHRPPPPSTALRHPSNSPFFLPRGAHTPSEVNHHHILAPETTRTPRNDPIQGKHRKKIHTKIRQRSLTTRCHFINDLTRTCQLHFLIESLMTPVMAAPPPSQPLHRPWHGGSSGMDRVNAAPIPGRGRDAAGNVDAQRQRNTSACHLHDDPKKWKPEEEPEEGSSSCCEAADEKKPPPRREPSLSLFFLNATSINSDLSDH